MASTQSEKAPLARLAFPSLIPPGKRVSQKTGQEVDYWSCTLLFPKTLDLSGLKKLAADAIQAEWGDKGTDMVKQGLIKNPFLDGDGPQGVNKKTGDRSKGFEGHTFIRVGSYMKPKLFDKRVIPITEGDELYAGCFVNAVINAFTWTDARSGKGVSFGLQALQFVRDGERLGGGGIDPAKFFETIEDDASEMPAGARSGAGADALFQ